MENFIFCAVDRRSKYIHKQSTAKTLTQLHYFKTFLSAYSIIRLSADVSIKLGMQQVTYNPTLQNQKMQYYLLHSIVSYLFGTVPDIVNCLLVIFSQLQTIILLTDFIGSTCKILRVGFNRFICESTISRYWAECKLFLKYIGRNCCPQMFFEIGVLKNLANINGKHLCWSLFLIKLQTGG